MSFTNPTPSEATKKFVEDLEAGKFKKDTYPNSPPYFYGTKEEVDAELTNLNEFLDSDLFEFLKNL